MATKFLIELEDEDKILDLIVIMEGVTQAVHCRSAVIVEAKTPEISSSLERIFQAAGRSYQVMPFTVELSGPYEPEMARLTDEELRVIVNAAQPSAPADQPEKANGKVKNGKTCAICKGPTASPRSTVCEKPDCKKERQRRYQLRSDLKRGKRKAADPKPAEPEPAEPSALDEQDQVFEETLNQELDQTDPDFEEYAKLLEQEDSPISVTGEDPEGEAFEELMGFEDDSPGDLVWTLCATGDRMNDSMLKQMCENRELTPGTLLRKRGGKWFTLNGFYEPQEVELNNEVAAAFLRQERKHQNR